MHAVTARAPERSHERYAALLRRCRELAPLPAAVVWPCDRASLEGAVAAAEEELLLPLLVGSASSIRAAAAREGLDLGQCEIVDAPDPHCAAATAVELARDRKVRVLVKGSLHSDELLHPLADERSGLHTGRRMSHAFVVDLPSYEHPLIVTDAVVNIAPSLEHKRDIVQNAIGLAHTLGIALPNVAVLAAVETVNPRMLSTVEAAALAKMAERGQITGAVVDGPLALDDAISTGAAKSKGIVSRVAGQAHVVVAPEIESANILAKAAVLIGGADAAGIVLGARVPVALTSRFADARTRIASAAMAVLLAERS